MWVTQICIRNFLGISNFKTENVGKVNSLQGGNGKGKTAVSNAIRCAIESSGVAPELIKLHEHEAEILIEIDGKIGIRRRLTESANQLKVTVDGQPMNAPQKFLDSIVGPFNFNPVDFYLKKGKERRRDILSAMPFTLTHDRLVDALGDSLIPIDLTKYDYSRHGLELLEAIRKDVYERRYEQNLEVTRLKKAIEQDRIDIPQTFNRETFQSSDLAKLTGDLSVAKMAVNQHTNDERRLADLRNQAEAVIAHIDSLKKQITEEEAKLARITDDGKALKTKLDAYEAPDIQSIQNQLDEYQRSQRLMIKLEEIDRKGQQLATAELAHKTLDELHEKLVLDVPRKVLQQMKLPVDGLKVEGDEIKINGISIDTLSTSEQIQFAVKIARSLAGPLKLICVDRFESLDADARAAFEHEALSDEFQYIITQVTSGDLNLEVRNPEQPTPTPAAYAGPATVPKSAKSKAKSRVDF